ncbi:urate oxidase [Kribbella amoyensis]|uniref:Uricase n=1 Tax=Kribbella amoyensis TaxID=996641 RepID=A0A561B2Q4_9ACTN|nr:urate oxidase [Kribbella amoyensis]TWD73138.1 urate oxidase [Kribbella amoyensis]
MAIVLGPNQYGKAETRVVRVYRDTARHELRDLAVSTALRGDFEAAHVTGDQAAVLPTDSQKNTVFAYAAEKGIRTIEDFGLQLGRHFVEELPAVDGAQIGIDEYSWDRVNDYSFVRRGQETRTTVVTVADDRAWVVSGLKDLVIAKTTGSEFRGFLQDRYTTLPETDDRILATSLIARWRYTGTELDWDASWSAIRTLLLTTFAEVYSHALQHTLYAMGQVVLEQRPEVAEIRFSAPNRHHFLVDLEPFGVENPGEVFFAADRPYGLIEATVLRDDGPDPGPAWYAVPGFC